MKTLKDTAAFLHLWLGLISGIIITIVAVTGSIYAFEEELFNLFHKDVVYAHSKGPYLPLQKLQEQAKKALVREEKISRIEVKPEGFAYVFSATKANKKSTSLFYFDQVKYDKDVYVDPVSGQVLGTVNQKYQFFTIVLQIHRCLLFKKAIGSVIVGSAVLMFFFIILTGFIIWLPKKLKNLKQRLTVKWDAKFKRLNYDLHSTFGFYVIPFALIIVITGLVWSFKWWETGIFKLMGSDKKPILTKEYVQVPGEKKSKEAYTLALDTILKLNQDNFSKIILNYPEGKKAAMMATVETVKTGDGWRGLSYYYFNPNTGLLFDQLLHKDKPLGLKWRNSNLDIHDGSLFGWPTRVIVFFSALICASLPTTGFLIWWGKKKKKK